MTLTSRLSNQAKLLLFISSLYSFSSLLSGTFVPIYLWKYSGSYIHIGSYILAQYLSSGLLFYLCGQAVKQGKKRQIMQLGAFSSALFYGIILLFGTYAHTYIMLLGLVYGIGVAFFWLTYNVYYFEITDANNRDRYNGWQGMLTACCGILAPYLSSRLIVWLGSDLGYRIIFICSLILYAIIIVLSIKLEKRKEVGQFNWKFPLYALLKPNKQWSQLGYSIIAQGIREGMFLSMLPLIIYIATKNEGQIGTYTLVTSLLAFVSNYILGKTLKKHFRNKAMLIGALGSWLAVTLILIKSGFSGLILFGSITAIVWPLFIVPFTSIVFDQIGKNKEAVKLKEEIIVFRELALMIGRFIGLIPFFIYSFWLSQYEINLGWILLLVGISPLISVFFIVKINKNS